MKCRQEYKIAAWIVAHEGLEYHFLSISVSKFSISEWKIFLDFVMLTNEQSPASSAQSTKREIEEI